MITIFPFIGADNGSTKLTRDTLVDGDRDWGGHRKIMKNPSIKPLDKTKGQSDNKHRIAKREQPETPTDGPAIEVHHRFLADKGPNQHQEATTRHVEIGHQARNHLEFVALSDEQIGNTMRAERPSRGSRLKGA